MLYSKLATSVMLIVMLALTLWQDSATETDPFLFQFDVFSCASCWMHSLF